MVPVNPNFAPPNYPTFQNPQIQPQFHQPQVPTQMIPPIQHQPPPVVVQDPNIFANLADDQKLLLEQVMKLTPEQLEKLTHHEQQQIMQLRQTMMNTGLYPAQRRG